MKSARRLVVWVSTSRRTRGGIAAYVRALTAGPLATRWEIHRVTTHTDGSAALRIATFAVGAVRYVGLLVAHRPALVHLHTASYGSFVRKALLALPARVLRVPLIVHVHGAEFHDFHDRAPAIVRRWIRWTLGGSARVIALGDVWAVRLRRIAPEATVVVVPNGVALAPRPVPAPRDGEPVQVVFLGRIDDRKGAFTLLEAWAKAVGRAGAARLVLAGDGEVDRARATVARLGIGATAEVRGWLGPAEAAALLTGSHVLALPSRAEGQPMAVLEAMAHGLCVIGSPAGGVPDMLADGCGLLVPADAPAALASALEQVLADDELRAATGTRARERVRTTYDNEIVWRRLDALYREVETG